MSGDKRNKTGPGRERNNLLIEGNQVKNISTRNNLPDINIYKILQIWMGTSGLALRRNIRWGNHLKSMIQNQEFRKGCPVTYVIKMVMWGGT
jgi:hypothetical protein